MGAENTKKDKWPNKVSKCVENPN